MSTPEALFRSATRPPLRARLAARLAVVVALACPGCRRAGFARCSR
ncbi:hypothetical protein [Saccharopolyspora gregorii]